jgi:predicted Rossmann fold flavoprotein
MTIAIIGAGASGMTAALQAAWNGASVTLFERNPSVGRKLLVTGSGRCNITNQAVQAVSYTCADSAWMETLLGQFGVHELLIMLAEIGIPVHKTYDGWYYPLSDSAHSVVAAFTSALDLAEVQVVSSAQVTSMIHSDKGIKISYLHDSKQLEKTFTRVILSAGGKAYPSLGSRGELFPTLERLGHTVLAKRPALAPILADLGNLKPLQGVRLDVGVTLWEGSKRLAATTGNMIFTQWGLNGPSVMDLSHHISANPTAKLALSLNLLATIQDAFDQLLAQKRRSAMPLRVFLGAFFPPKVVELYLQNAHLSQELILRDVDDSTLKQLIENLQNTRLSVKGLRDFEYCQVSAGGVPVIEVNSRTLESLRIQGLYLTGETLDVVGPCGGYNLQFAFSSGALAGKAAAAASLQTISVAQGS